MVELQKVKDNCAIQSAESSGPNYSHKRRPGVMAGSPHETIYRARLEKLAVTRGTYVN